MGLAMGLTSADGGFDGEEILIEVSPKLDAVREDGAEIATPRTDGIRFHPEASTQTEERRWAARPYEWIKDD